MKPFKFNKEKNEKLKKDRGISFDDIINAINSNKLLETISHPNTKKYPHQKMYVVKIGDYIFLVPFVEEKEYMFLKTVIPSRKYTKIYLRR